MNEHCACPTCRAPWAREKYQPVDRVVVTCGNGHPFLVGELRPGSRYVKLTPIDGEEGSRTG